MGATVFVDGDQGTTGLQIMGRLQGRTDISVRTLPAPLRKDEAASRAARPPARPAPTPLHPSP